MFSNKLFLRSSFFCFVALVVFHLSASKLSAQIIPDGRRIEWTPGVPGGIPVITGPVENVVTHGADPTGISDSKSAFVAAMNALPGSGGVVYIPEGEYLIGSTIQVTGDNIVFRGTGISETKLIMNFSGKCFEIVTYERGDWQEMGDISKDTQILTVPDGSKFAVGQFAEIQQDNDPAVMYTQPEWNVSWAQDAVGQLFEVTAVSGNQVTLKTKVHLDFSASLNPKIRPQGFVEKVGFEDFYIEKSVSGDHTFAFKNVAYCWIKNVESYHTRKSHVDLNTSLGCEIRDSYFHHSFSYGSGGSGYGVRCGFHTSDVLVENNIFDMLRHAMMVALGANGNVFGYNYSINNVQGDGETNLNQGWTPPDISIHGFYGFMNLFEGNDNREIGIGDYWGPAGKGNTYFRNEINGDGIFYNDHSHYQNVLGNITPVLEDVSDDCDNELEHGNVISGVVIWDPDIPDQNLPDSYYLPSKPDFFGDLQWPPYGPEMDAGNILPAQLRMETYLSITYLDELRAEQKEDKIELGWSSATEENCHHFVIQRSLDAQDWVTCGEVACKGNLTDPCYYKAYDENPPEGLLYYRLQQVDNNGKSFYSNIANVFFGKTNFSFYPNPSFGDITFVLSGNSKANVRIWVFDILGNIVFQQRVKSNRIRTNFNHLPPGVYFIELNGKKARFILE